MQVVYKLQNLILVPWKSIVLSVFSRVVKLKRATHQLARVFRILIQNFIVKVLLTSSFLFRAWIKGYIIFLLLWMIEINLLKLESVVEKRRTVLNLPLIKRIIYHWLWRLWRLENDIVLWRHTVWIRGQCGLRVYRNGCWRSLVLFGGVFILLILLLFLFCFFH